MTLRWFSLPWETYDESELGTYQDGRVEFHNDRRLTLQNGARMPFFILVRKSRRLTRRGPTAILKSSNLLFSVIFLQEQGCPTAGHPGLV
jgi:hypothetical protein